MATATNISGTAGADDLSATNGGSTLNGNKGDDILRGGRGDDIITGGQGNDKMYGGDGADTFRFFGLNTSSSSAAPSGVETDRIYDFDFSEGDKFQFLAFSEASANAVIDSYADLVDLVNNSGWNATELSNGNLMLSYDFGNGIVQNINITGAAAEYHNALIAV
jgi:Ca2+-binding RTX toxin-like protein